MLVSNCIVGNANDCRVVRIKLFIVRMYIIMCARIVYMQKSKQTTEKCVLYGIMCIIMICCI